MTIEEAACKIIIDEKLGCWLWQGAKNATGYAAFSSKRVHILLFEDKHKRKVKVGLELDHKFSNKGCPRHCVNPDHMEEVTHQENVRRGKNSKLNEWKVTKIKELILRGLKNAVIAKDFDVSRNMIMKIRRGICWEDVCI
jgi:hypothetical protein